MTSRRKLIIDCDVGTDDAQAILMALNQPELDVIAITSVAGNASIDHTTKNTLRILALTQRKIPVYRGSERSFVGREQVSDGFHGADGFGNKGHLYPTDDSLLQEEHATDALVRMANQQPGEITLIAIGPLTNLAHALKLDPHFGQKLKDCFIMGGNTPDRENRPTPAEFNFHCDPEAAAYVIDNLGCSITLASRQICEENYLPWRWYNELVSLPSDKAKFVKDIDTSVVENSALKGKYPAWDQLAMATFIDSTVATETREAFVTVETECPKTKGQMIIQSQEKMTKPPNVTLITKVDIELYKKYIWESIK